MGLMESVKMNLCGFEWMNMCVILVNLEDKVNGFENKLYES